MKRIKAISVVEAKLLMRSFTVRFMWVLFLLITAFFVVVSHIGGNFSLYVPGALATKAYFFFSLTRLILSSFIAPVFVHTDAKQDTFQSIHPRPFSNFSYTFGKLIGFTSVMLRMDYICMLMLFVSSSLLPGMTISAWPYLLYPIIITFPLCVFMFGVNVLVARIYYPLVFAVPIVMLMVFLPLEDIETSRAFDLGAITLPLAYSAITGFYDLTPIISQRLMYIFSGIGLVLLSSLLMYFFRASDDRRMYIRIAGFTGLAFLFASASFLFSNGDTGDAVNQKWGVVNLSDNYWPVRIDSSDIVVTHAGKSIDVKSTLMITNTGDEPIDKIYLKHHIAFETYQITSESHRIRAFSNPVDAIRIDLSTPLQPSECMDIEIADAGSITQSGGYFHIPIDMLTRVHRSDLTVLGKQYAFLEPDYVLLPPEINWYPTSYTGYDITEPGYLQRDLTRFSLTVITGDGMVPISQGKMTEKGNNTYQFEPEIPLTQISLTIGPYQKVSMDVDGIEYSYHWIGENPFAGVDISTGTLEDAIRNVKEGIEHTLQCEYPFKRYRIVETPIHYFGYQSPFALSGPYEQPEIRFIPESSITINNYFKPIQGKVQNGVTILTRVLFPKLYTTKINSREIISKMNPPSTVRNLGGFWQFMTDPFADYSHLLTQYAVFARGPISDDDVFNLLAVNWLRSQFIVDDSGLSSSLDLNYRTLKTASSQFLSTKSLKDILSDGKYYNEYMEILNMASQIYFDLLAAKSGVDITLLETMLFKGFASTEFDVVSELSELCDTDVLALLDEFSQQKGKAHYIISDQTISRHFIDDRYIYNVRFNISNPTPYHGLIVCAIYVHPEEQDRKVVYLEPFTKKEVGLISLKEVPNFYVKWLPFGPKNSKMYFTDIQQHIPAVVQMVEPDKITFFRWYPRCAILHCIASDSNG